MAGALASGIPFQGSINWAMNVINGVEGAASGYMAPDGENDAAGSADGQGSARRQTVQRLRGRPFSGREANHSSAERRLGCGLAKIQF